MRNTTLYKNVPKTFRRSSTKVLADKRQNVGWGGNLQNIEKALRAIYIPDGPFNKQDVTNKCKYWLETGDLSVFTEEELSQLRALSQADQSGAEALIVAYDSEPKEYRKLFIHGIKPHVYIGLKLFVDVWKKKIHEHKIVMDEDDVDILNITPIDKLRMNPNWKALDKLIKSSDNWALSERYYYLAKQTCHSANYDIQGATFRMNILEKSGGKIVISQDDADRFLLIYRGLFPEIPESNQRIRQQVDKFGILYNLFGHPYQITNYNITERTYKEYYAWPRQSTVAEITRTAYCMLQEFIESSVKRWDILADTHDSYMVQHPLQDTKEVHTKMQEYLAQEFISPVDGARFKMKSEVNVGFNWGPFYSADPEKNPLGLREVDWTKNLN